DLLGAVGLDGDVGEQPAGVAVGVAHLAAGVGAVGAADFLTDLEAEAVGKDLGEHAEAAGEADVAGVGGGPVKGEHAFGDGGGHGQGGDDRFGGQGQGAGVLERGLGRAVGQSAEGGGHGGDGGVGVEVADEGE